MGRFLALAFVSIAAVAAAGASTAPAPPRGTLLFASTRGSDLHDEIWVLDTRNGSRRNLSRNPGSDRAPAPSPDGSSVAFVSDRNGADAIWIARGRERPRRLTKPFRESEALTVSIESFTWSPRGDAIAFWLQRGNPAMVKQDVWLVTADGRSTRRLAANVGLSAAWSPDGRSLAVTDGSHTSGSVRDRRGRILRRLPGPVVGWSSRGDLAVARERRIQILRPDGRTAASVPGFSARWSPDGSHLAVERQQGFAVVARNGARRFFKAGMRFALWAPDSRSLVAQDSVFATVMVGLDGSVEELHSRASPIAWSPGGALTLVAGAELQIRRGSSVRRFRLPSRPGSCPASAGSVRWIDRDRVVYAYGANGQHTSGLWVVGAAGSPVRPFKTSETRWTGTPRWSPSGDRVVYEEGPVLTHAGECSRWDTALRLVRADGSGGTTVASLDRGPAANPRWSPDGRYIAYEQRSLSEEEDFGIFVADTAANGAKSRLSTGFSGWPSFASDGRSIVFEAPGSQLRRVVVATGATTLIGRGRLPEAAPSEPLVAFVRGNEVWVSGLDGAEPRRVIAFRPLGQQPPRWSPDSSKLALADTRGVLVVDRVTGAARMVSAPGVAGIEWSPDGRRLSFARVVGRYSRQSPYSAPSAYSDRTELYVVPATGGAPRRLTRDLANVTGASWRP